MFRSFYHLHHGKLATTNTQHQQKGNTPRRSFSAVVISERWWRFKSVSLSAIAISNSSAVILPYPRISLNGKKKKTQKPKSSTEYHTASNRMAYQGSKPSMGTFSKVFFFFFFNVDHFKSLCWPQYVNQMNEWVHTTHLLGVWTHQMSQE